jgi:flagellar hook-associated protein 3 FlgL
MDNTDASLGEASNVFMRLKELAVQASNDTYNAEQRQAIAKEIDQLNEHLESLANTRVNGKYIFNGTNVNTKPVDIANIEKTVADVTTGNGSDYLITYKGKQFTFDTDSAGGTFLFKNGNEQIQLEASTGNVLYDEDHTDTVPSEQLLEGDVIFSRTNSVATNTQDFEVEVMKGIHVGVNIRPQNVFSAEMFKDISDFFKTLEAPDSTAENIKVFLNKFEGHLDNVTSERAELGARLNRVELIENRLGQQEIIAKQTMSENEDVDFEKVIIDLKTQESIHRAALAAGARIIQPTLMDFLR